MPPKKREKKTKARGQNIVQTVKVVLAGEAKRRKRQYKKRVATGARGRGQAGAVGPNTIYGDALPIPPKVVEVPVPYRLTEGATTASGVAPKQTTTVTEVPASVNVPLLQNISPEQKRSIMSEMQQAFQKSSQQKPLLMSSASSQTEEKSLETEMFADIKPRSTFYKPYERKPSVFNEEPKKSPMMEYSIKEPSSIEEQKPSNISTLTVSEPKSPRVESITAESIDIPIEVEEKKPSLFQYVISGSQKLALGVAEKTTGLPIGKAVKTAAEIFIPKSEQSESEVGIRGEAVGPSPFKRKANWNVTQQLISVYASKSGKSMEQSKRALSKIRKEHPNAKPSDVITAIESGDFTGKTLA